MKSLVEEASTIVKALEKAWTRAGKPQTFSVKIFEEEETNFFGFTKKSAKVGIFFEETQPSANETKKTPLHGNAAQNNNQRPFRSRDNRRDNQSQQNRQGGDNKQKHRSSSGQGQHRAKNDGYRNNNNNEHPRQNVVQKPQVAPSPEETPKQTAPAAPVVSSKPTTPPPAQRKVLKISGRCYSAQKKNEE